jgi:hypothetical protein
MNKQSNRDRDAHVAVKVGVLEDDASVVAPRTTEVDLARSLNLALVDNLGEHKL